MSRLVLIVVFALIGIGLSEAQSRTDVLRQCRRNADTGPCKGNFKKWYFSTRTQKCAQMAYGGCGGNNNQFDSEQQCIDICYNTPSCVMEIPARIERDCYGHTYTKIDGCMGYYLECPNAKPDTRCSPPEQPSVPADCTLKIYKWLDGCQKSVVDCTQPAPIYPPS